MARSLIDAPLPLVSQVVDTWRCPTLPSIASAGISVVRLNFETTGLKWFDGDVPVGFALDYPVADGFASLYHPWDDRAKDWMNREIRDGVLVENINTRFDVHVGREVGVDFEAKGC